jgi:predicted GNAT superfamily acetyltransferase
VRIRPLRTAADYAACVELQRRIWGPAAADTVPPIVLLVSQQVGGIAAGAFAPTGRLLGCVFGLTGVRGGRLVHWSHLLAVRPEARDRGIGRRLKQYQRARLRRLGISTMYWTFDPLVARNAHLNLNRLGARVDAYVRDLYGPAGEGPLDRAIGTDRFIVRWDLRRAGPRAPAGRRGAVRVAIPPDIHALRDADPRAAARWRRATRAAFERALRRGYRVVGFDPDPVAPHYVLAHRRGGR